MSAEALSPEALELLERLTPIGCDLEPADLNDDEYRKARRELQGFFMTEDGCLWRLYPGDVLLATVNQEVTTERNRLADELEAAIEDEAREFDADDNTAAKGQHSYAICLLTKIARRLRTEGTEA